MVLQREVHAYKKMHPGSSDADAIKVVARHKVPAGIVGSPKWHAAKLADLIAMVNAWGMPHFFLTLTAGDRVHNGDQWQEVRSVASRQPVVCFTELN